MPKVDVWSLHAVLVLKTMKLAHAFDVIKKKSINKEFWTKTTRLENIWRCNASGKFLTGGTKKYYKTGVNNTTVGASLLTKETNLNNYQEK